MGKIWYFGVGVTFPYGSFKVLETMYDKIVKQWDMDPREQAAGQFYT